MRVHVTSTGVSGWFELGGPSLTASLSAAVAGAGVDDAGARLFFPPGDYHFDAPLRFGNNIQLIGSGRRATRLIFDESSAPGPRDAPAIGRAPELRGEWSNFAIRDLTLSNQRASGGYGLDLVSATHAFVQNVVIEKFRNPQATGCGVRLVNSPEGGCYHNRFDQLEVSDCDTGILMDAAVGDTACGYATFTATVVNQEVDCVVLKRSVTNGSVDNRFFGLMLQASSKRNARHFLVIEGVRNHVESLVIDGARATDAYDVWFRKGPVDTPAGNRISGAGNYDLGRVRDDNGMAAGPYNTIDGWGTFVGGAGLPWYLNGQRVAAPRG